MIKTILRIMLIGMFVGLFVTFFQYVSHLVIDLSEFLINKNIGFHILSIGVFIIVGIIIIFTNKKIPGYYGSGIPQIEGYQRGWYSFNPISMLMLVMVNSFYAFFGGFLLGGEGPSISISSSIGMIINKIFKTDEKHEVAAAGSAGFGCAFMSPLAGLCHLIEENKQIFNIRLIFKGIVIIIISFTISYLIFPHSLLPFFDITSFNLKYWWLFIPLIIFSVVFGRLYIFLIIKVKDLTKGKQIMIYLTLIFGVMFIIIKKYYPLIVGSGGNTFNLNIIDVSLVMLFVVLLVRLIFTALSVSSCLSGGVVLPMLSIGALVGSIVIKMYSLIDNNVINYTGVFVIIGMLIVFAVVTNAPLTAFVLGLKCAPIKVIVLPLFICLILAMIPYYLLKWENIYHMLEKRLNGYEENHI